MKTIRFIALMCLVILTSCNSIQKAIGPPHPDKYAREFLQSKGYPPMLIETLMHGGRLSDLEFYQFGNSENENVRYMIASNKYTPAALLRKLAEDSNTLVRQGVAGNTSITKEVIDILNKDYIIPNVDNRRYDWRVRSTLVQNLSVPDGVILEIYEKRKAPLEKISLDYFARNPNCPVKIKQAIDNSWNSKAKQILKTVDDAKKAGVYVQGKDGRWYKP